MPNVVRFVLSSARTLDVPGAGTFINGVLDIEADDLRQVARTRWLVQPYQAVELGIVDEDTPPPTLPAVPGPPIPDPYPQYLDPTELLDPSSGKLLESKVPARLSDVELRAAFGRPKALAKFDAALAASEVEPCRIVFAGSSTPAGTGATTEDQRFVNRLVARIQKAHPAPSGTSEAAVIASTTADFGTLAATPGVYGYNAAEGGATALSVLDADERTKIAALNPRAIFFMVGSNDFFLKSPAATYKARMQDQLTDLKSKISGPCVYVLIQALERYDPDIAPVAPWSAYGDALRELVAADPDNVVFLDLSEAFRISGNPGTDPFGLVLSDNTHLTDAGHAFAADLLARALGVPGAKPVAGASLTSNVEVARSRLTSDTFTGGDVADINGRSMDAAIGGVAKPWTATAGNMAISGGRLVRGATVGSSFGGVQVSRMDVEVGLTMGTLQGGGSVTLALHRSDSNAVSSSGSAYRLAITSNGALSLSKKIVGTTTILISSATLATTMTPGDRLVFRYYRGTLQVRVNGVLKGSVAVSEITTPGWAGLELNSANTTIDLDDFTVDVLT